MLLSTDKLCNVKKTEFQRSIKIPNILGVTKSTSRDNFEFVVHVKDEYDYRFMCNVRDELFDCLKQVFYLSTGKNLPVYGVEGKLKEFAASKKDVQQKVMRIPAEQFRLADEDLYEEHEQSHAKALQRVSSTPE